MSWKECVTIEMGDIAESNTEAVVNAANNELWMGSGVAGALRRAGGAVIEQEAVRQGPINVGEAVLTSGGKLPALNVIHAAGMAAGRSANPESVRAATLSSLKVCVESSIDSVAFPALGTGVGGLSLSDCAEQMLSAVAEHCATQQQPAEIRFVLFGQNAYDIFIEAIETAQP